MKATGLILLSVLSTATLAADKRPHGPGLAAKYPGDAHIAKDPAVLYGGTTGGMYRSEDSATTWKKINNGLIPDSELMASMSMRW